MRRQGSEPPMVHQYIINGGSGGRGGAGQGTGGAGGAGMGPTLTYEIRAENFIMNNANHGVFPTAIYLLQNAVAMDALHNSAVSFPRAKFHTETQTELLDSIYQRATDTNPSHSIWWLYGPAGTGKSTVMRSLCQRLHDVGKLGGCFFFKRGHATCGNAKMLFATLAYQLTLCGQELRDLIARRVEADSSIFWRGMDVQLRTLILEPCKSLRDAPPLVLLIDGLDECEGHNVQQEILRLMGSAIADHSLSLRIIITSRPDPHIQEIFQEESFWGLADSIDIEDPNLAHIYPKGSDDDLARGRQDNYEPTLLGYRQVHHPVRSRSASKHQEHRASTALAPAPAPAVSPTFEYSTCKGRQRALCIGINYRGQSPELLGAVNDAKTMMSFLLRYRGYVARDIVLLTDDSINPRAQPTRANLLDAMRWLVNDARPHDSFCFYYSGLGGQTRKTDGQKNDGHNEAIYPLDCKSGGEIVDDDMHRIMVKPLPAGCRLTAIFDSRNCTPILDLPYVYSHRDRLQKVNERICAQKASSADVISWATSKDRGAQKEMIVEGATMGVMTHAFLKTIQANPHQSYKELLQNLLKILHPTHSQKPRLACSHPINTSLLFLV
ncbi:caspase domain-containing protein [Mycena sanguinolenta]|nr:caspase domain-containing protein [Mycena sanguinolenta]